EVRVRMRALGIATNPLPGTVVAQLPVGWRRHAGLHGLVGKLAQELAAVTGVEVRGPHVDHRFTCTEQSVHVFHGTSWTHRVVGTIPSPWDGALNVRRDGAVQPPNGA